ncbi:rho gdp-dissociation inhibitor 1 [Limosa lapponica baueri]|uniref:Rho GDP-dissociation inhibitor 1 n=1 Tax=Limosa lapponica baueri TaxID=1758121 RepID=A0A2I0T347_LIMLA|nr:rho gdp-dissociation inhibitor 1 [Limosa lapponica baueri]
MNSRVGSGSASCCLLWDSVVSEDLRRARGCFRDLESYKKQAFVLKEGVEYRIKISFRVNREIVSGLKYIQHTFRKGVKIDKTEYMVGSYGPRAEEYEFLTPMEEAPKGMLARGSYNIKSKFTDDDKTDHLSWEWNLTIKKDWKD